MSLVLVLFARVRLGGGGDGGVGFEACDPDVSSGAEWNAAEFCTAIHREKIIKNCKVYFFPSNENSNNTLSLSNHPKSPIHDNAVYDLHKHSQCLGYRMGFVRLQADNG